MVSQFYPTGINDIKKYYSNFYIISLIQGFVENGISVVAEWLMVFLILLVFLSFYPDYKNIKFLTIRMYDKRCSNDDKLCRF